VTVFLVGAGPGDPGLLTRRASALLRTADVVVFDRLVDPRIVALAPRGTQRFDVGKGIGRGESEKQESINQLLVRCAAEHDVVVRLKGGDPFLFGRGGEEVAALIDAGVHVEIVPGVSSALAVPAAAGIPLTYRDVASAVVIVTGHEVVDARFDWTLAAHDAVTVVVLMGMAQRRAIRDALVGAGRPRDTPVAVIEWGTTDRQQVVISTLDQLDLVALCPPCVIVIGKVVGLRPAEGASALQPPISLVS